MSAAKRSASAKKRQAQEVEESKVLQSKNRATVKEHYLENAATFEHPASFTASTKKQE